MDWLKPLLLMFYSQWPFLFPAFVQAGAWAAFGVLRDAAGSLFLLAFAFVPALVLFANLFERRGSFRLVLQQEYAALASAVFYAWAAAHIVALPLAWLTRRSGFEANVIEQTRQTLERIAAQQQVTGAELARWMNPQLLVANFAFTLVLPFVALWALWAVRVVFRVSW